ncbi:hypothetical protein QET93_004485 [Akkermansia sp. N21116]|uniref:hypothetical protein n=1 Tax=Akkermansia sp. N21116 TaxID=3040764 RepID=UPI00244E97F5|nr:hypothetical protein [Akkermansia sp. N21116]WPX41360.1 hypothetical protein QET93_004485 [Akkermansia sp. N21116]
MKQILKLLPFVTLALITSCENSTSSDSHNLAEAPESLDGLTFEGEMYVDYKEGEGFELEAKNFVFANGAVTFDAIEYDSNGNTTPRQVAGPYQYEKTGTQTGTLSTSTNPVSFNLNLIFSGNNVTASGTMSETYGSGYYPAKGAFTIR